MELNNFKKLALQAHHLDTGIEHLSSIWDKPDIFIGHFTKLSSREDTSEETNVHIEALWNSIQSTQEGVETTTLEVDKYVDGSTEHILQETRKEYELLKEQCDNIELILEKYGYRYDKDNPSDQQSSTSTDTYEQETFEKAAETLEVEFTPNLSWKCKAKQKEQKTSVSNISDTSNLFTTPIPKNSTSVLKDISLSCKHYLPTRIINTPTGEHPKESIYSKRFYNSSKK
ncbi:uncharacterized protein LOC143357806 [Halictus rubicundus]|uniref:uncharacterized protein LOC143357806 n=1 Tax=Halictus rubicundus TaxID=77578 RepID=UPI00403671F9